MLELTVLASGSSGNSLLVRGESTAVLVDAGLSARQLETQILALGIAPQNLAGILLTHEHGDHTRGLKVFCSKNHVPVFTNPLTADSLRKSTIDTEWRLFNSGSAFEIGELRIHPISVPHDAADPVGFVVSSANSSLGILTAHGYATRQILHAVAGVHALVIETNHDEALLQNDTKRPWSVKQRILSRHGHLSNQAAAKLVAEIATENLRHILLAHLSEDCNNPTLAREAILSHFADRTAPEIHCPGHEPHPLPHTVRV
ncbi:MAG: MBL fold metallo-hydrolase [Terrimicrobiaceae bacterium]